MKEINSTKVSRWHSLQTQIIIATTILMFLTSILPLSIISINSSNVFAEKHNELKFALLDEETSKKTLLMRDNLNEYYNIFRTISTNDQIQELLEWRIKNTSLDIEFNTLSSEEKIKGDFYPKRINSTILYKELYHTFLHFYELNYGVEMIRIFYEDGNVLVGVKLGNEDISDYKGDKSWFNDTMNITNKDEIYVSPISIARATNTPAIRIMKPLLYNNKTRGLIIVNFGANSILQDIKEQSSNSTYYSLVVDPNYENAEGDILGPLFLVNGINESYEFLEESAGTIEFSEQLLETKPKGEILIENNLYYYSAQLVELYNRNWYIILLEPKQVYDDIYQEIVSQYQQQSFIIISLLIVIILILGLVASKRLSKPIRKLSKELISWGEKDYSHPIEYKSKSELGLISQLMEETRKILKSGFMELKNSSDNMLKIAKTLAQSSEQVASTIETISTTQQSISQGMSQELTAITQTHKMLNDFEKQLKLMFKQLEEIKQANDAIEDFSNQTQMLSLNAAIEAARAKEKGRGFQVVAQQVRELAEQSNEQVQKNEELFVDIKNKINQQQKALIKLIEAMDSVAAIAEESSASTEESAAAAEEQTASIQQLTELAMKLEQNAKSLVQKYKEFVFE